MKFLRLIDKFFFHFPKCDLTYRVKYSNISWHFNATNYCRLKSKHPHLTNDNCLNINNELNYLTRSKRKKTHNERKKKPRDKQLKETRNWADRMHVSNWNWAVLNNLFLIASFRFFFHMLHGNRCNVVQNNNKTFRRDWKWSQHWRRVNEQHSMLHYEIIKS